MPEIIDNVKVGEFIKRLLKENEMTQDDLARELSISKSAVSQNLNGRSSFDIQNLMAIAKLFHLSVDELLSHQSIQDSNVISEYEKAVLKGLVEIQKVKPEDLNIKEPDMYGKVLIEYVIKHRKIDLFQYLDKANLLFVNEYYHRAKAVQLDIVRFMLEERLEGVLKYIVQYSDLCGSFEIDDMTSAEAIWVLLNQDHNRALLQSMFQAEITRKAMALSFFEYDKKIKILTKTSWLTLIGTYKLNIVLDEYLTAKITMNDYRQFFDTMIKFEFFDAIHLFVQRYITRKMNSIDLFSFDAQRIALDIAKTGNIALLELVLDKRLYTDLTEILCEAIRSKRNETIELLLTKHESMLVYRRVARSAVDQHNLPLLTRITNRLTLGDLDYLYGVAGCNDFDILVYLISKGAKLNAVEFNNETILKTNNLLEYLVKKGSK